jgi:hypothetical protein
MLKTLLDFQAKISAYKLLNYFFNSLFHLCKVLIMQIVTQQRKVKEAMKKVTAAVLSKGTFLTATGN